MPDPAIASQAMTRPDYEGLIRFLVEPFLEAPDSLRVDCEMSSSRPKIWVRLAFEGSDKGRVFGRGGRNIQAIRTVLMAVAQLAGYSAHLEIYGSHSQNRTDDTGLATSPPNRSRRPSTGRRPQKPNL